MNTYASVLQTPKILYLSKSEIIKLGGNSSNLYIEAVSYALTLHARGEIIQPLKPYLRWRGNENHIADRIIAMPAYLGGDNP
ncbi:2,3-diaminopropionate biosynthesis protein SbnB, partial [Staphylococcus aureus]|nr:2,3-diaminopropionate biosynthesis protein SbnB [Staphylococcus aureus]